MDKTEDQIQAERDAVAAMKNSKANMEKMLGRIATLEAQLWRSRDFIKAMKGYVPANLFIRKSGTQSNYHYESTHSEIDAMVAKCSEVLGHG